MHAPDCPGDGAVHAQPPKLSLRKAELLPQLFEQMIFSIKVTFLTAELPEAKPQLLSPEWHHGERVPFYPIHWPFKEFPGQQNKAKLAASNNRPGI